MAKFKVGDKIQCVRMDTPQYNFLIGEEATVTAVTEWNCVLVEWANGKTKKFSDQRIGDNHFDYWDGRWGQHYFEIGCSSPLEKEIRTYIATERAAHGI